MIHLNSEQQQSVKHLKGPLMVIAGAGTGKTRVITERIAYLIQSCGVKPSSILGLTFTDKAALEMEERLDILMPIGYEPINLKTFHGFGDLILRQYGIEIGISPSYKILQGLRHWQFIKDHLFEFNLNYYRPLGNPTRFIDLLIQYFGRLKEDLISPEKYLTYTKKKLTSAIEKEEKMEAEKHLELAEAFQFYTSLMEKNDFLDFSDLQVKCLNLFEKRPNILSHLQNHYQYILVDEYQDTNIAQNEIVDQLAKKHQNLMVVGDDDQSIYKFRGAAISNILKFEEKYPNASKVVLTQNYRSNQSILDFAYTSIQNNNPNRLEVKSGLKKKLIAQSSGESDSVEVIHCSTINQEVERVLDYIQKSKNPLSEIAILGRANSHLYPFIEAFQRNNIPYQFPSEKGLYSKKEIQDLIAVLRVIANPFDDISFYRVIRFPIWNLPMEKIISHIQTAKKSYISLWLQLKKDPQVQFLVNTFSDLIEYSKTHSVGEVLYHFSESIQLYDRLLKVARIEAEERLVNIAHFFEKIKQFEKEGLTQNTVIDFIRYLDMAEEAGENPSASFEVEGREGIQVSTIHASKGLEFNTVFITSLSNRKFPADNRKSALEIPNELVKEVFSEEDFHLQEERRLFYVAITRAKEKLFLMHSDFYNPSSALKPRKAKLSIFLDEIKEKATYLQSKKTTDGIESFLKPKLQESDLGIQKNQAQADNSEKRTTFSYSQLSTFERCPRQYQYQYIYKIPAPPDGNLSFGSTMHNTLLEYYKLVGQSRQASLFSDFDPDLSLDKLLEIYENKWIDQGYESKVHMEKRKERGKEILSLFYERFKNNLPQVKFLEKGFRLKVGDYTLTGRIDRADQKNDGSLEIIDYKSGRSRSQKEVDSNLQLTIYAMAARDCFGIPASLLTLYFLDDNEAVSTESNEKKEEKAKQKIIQLGNEINQSNFEPKPGKFKCEFCAYRKICDVAY